MQSQQPHIYRSNYGPASSVPTDISISQFLERYNPDDAPDDQVILEESGKNRKITYRQFREDASRAAWTFKQKLGLGEEDPVCVCAPNSIEVVRLIHAIIWAGGTAVLINPLSSVTELIHYISLSRPKIIAASDATWPKLDEALKQEKWSSQRIFVKSDPNATSDIPSNMLQSTEMYQRAIPKLPPLDLSDRDNRDFTAVVCFSSGTTGKGKGVELSHHNLLATMISCRTSDPTTWNSSVRGVFFAPLCHIYGLMTIALMGAWLGNYTSLMDRFDLVTYVRTCADTKAHIMRILPTIAVSMSKLPEEHLRGLESVQFIMCSGAVLPSATIDFFHAKFPNAPLYQGYGMTETNIAMLRPSQAHVIGSVGKLFAGIECRVIDEDGKDVKPGGLGECIVRGPSVFRRYLKDPASTAGTYIRDSSGTWLRTGDVVRIDNDGFMFLVDRMKELIKYKGLQVPPAELEGHLNDHPHVAESAVCALWDAETGTEVPIAYVTLTEEGKRAMSSRDPSSMLADIRIHVDGKVAPYKKLRGGVEVLEELPKTGSGKVMKRLLPARLRQARTSKI